MFKNKLGNQRAEKGGWS